MFLAALWSLGFFIFYVLPECEILFRRYTWNYPDDTFTFCSNLDDIVSIPILIATLAVYLLTLFILYRGRTMAASVIAQATVVKGPRLSLPSHCHHLAGHEVRLLIQSLLHFILASSVVGLWQFTFESDYATALINMYWVLYNGSSSVLYLMMNASIRRRVMHLWARTLGLDHKVHQAQPY